VVKLSAMCIDTAPVCCPSWVSGPVVMSSCRYMQGLRMLCGAMNSFIARWRTRVYKLPTARIVHKARVILVHYTVPSLLQSPAYRSSDSGRLLYCGCVLSFSPPQIFRHPWADFCETLPHDAVCSEIFYLLCGCSYMPPKNLRDENPQFFY